MRCLLAVVVLVGCEAAPEIPAHVDEIAASIPVGRSNFAMAFDVDDSLVFMDSTFGSPGLRRLIGDQLVTIPDGGLFSSGTMCVDRDGVLLIGGSSAGELARLEPVDQLVATSPGPPPSFRRCTVTPSGAYHVLPFDAETTMMLPAGGSVWVDSKRAFDRTQRAVDGTFYAILDGNVVTLGMEDSPTIVASCTQIGGANCRGLELAGVDGAGHLHMAIAGRRELYILDPATGTYREIALPGTLVIEAVITGTQYALMVANDPVRESVRSLWLLADGGDRLLRFGTLRTPSFGGLLRLLLDHSDNGYVFERSRLLRVVLE